MSNSWGVIRGSVLSHPRPTVGNHCTDRPTTGHRWGGRAAKGKVRRNHINNRTKDGGIQVRGDVNVKSEGVYEEREQRRGNRRP